MAQVLGFCISAIFLLVMYILDKRNKDANSSAKLEDAIKQIAVYQHELNSSQQSFEAKSKELTSLQERFEKLQFQKISSEVKLGQKAEHLLPFLDSFPYKDAEIKGLFQPIDLIVFTNDEVVFVEVKTGSAQLSEKERKIRDNIKAGRVRFEVHRINEKGITVK